MSLNLASILHHSAQSHPDAPALIHDDVRLNYRELAAKTEAFAAHLRGLGVAPGEHVALLMPNRISFTIAYYAILHAGATVVPVNFLSVGREVAYTLNDSDAVLLLAWHEYADAAQRGFAQADRCRHLLLVSEVEGPLTVTNTGTSGTSGTSGASTSGTSGVDWNARCDMAWTGPGDTAVILYTSGTTGQPKGAELTQFNMYSNAQWCAERGFSGAEGAAIGPGYVILSALPLFHSFGQTCNQNAAMFGGATLTYLERFDPTRCLEVMERDRVTVFAGVPTMYFQLLNVEDAERYDLSSLQFCMSGGAAMPVDVMREFDGRYGVKILEGYGLSETSPVATFNSLARPRKPGSIGTAIYGCEVSVVDADDREVPRGEVGEVVIRGYNIMKGYYKKPEATSKAFKNNWFHSGDMGRQDEDGYFYIVDRKKDMILRGGYNVYPRELEEVFYSHPDIREAAVVGVPDAQYGEEVKAFVSLKPESRVTVEDLLAFGKENIAATKYPRLIEILPELPKGPTGKILRKELRDTAS